MHLLYKFMIAIYVTTFICNNNILASAWMPCSNRYKYMLSFASIDSQSIQNKAKMERAYYEIMQTIAALNDAKLQMNNKSTRYLEIEKMINVLNREKDLLSAYTEDKLISTTIEYGINDTSSLGVEANHTRDKFGPDIQRVKKTNTQTASMFYKVKLLHNAKYIISLQPKIHLNQQDNYRNRETFYETAVAFGASKKNRKLTFILDSAITFGFGINRKAYKKQYYSLALSETVKFPYNIMLVNFSKYNIRNNCNPIYYKTLYEQISLAKELNLNSKKIHNINVQIGYFWDRSLVNTRYNVSGAIFSIWSEI